MKKIVYIDMDDTLCQFAKAYEEAYEKNPHNKFPQAEYGFFANLEPIDGAIESVFRLINSEKHDPWILTAPSVKNPMCYTEKRVWIEKYFGIDFCEKLIISPNKALLKGDYLIDDFNYGKGQDQFEGELIHFGSQGFPDWFVIRKYLGI